MDKITLNDLSKTRMKHLRRRIAKALREGMRKQEMKQYTLAKRSGVHTSTLSDIVNEKVNCKVETLAKLEAGLGLNLLRIIENPENFEI